MKNYRVTWNTGAKILSVIIPANRPEDAVRIMRLSAPQRKEIFEAVEIPA